MYKRQLQQKQVQPQQNYLYINQQQLDITPDIKISNFHYQDLPRYSYKQIQLAYDNTVVVISNYYDKVNLTHIDQYGKQLSVKTWRNVNYFTMITEEIVCILIVFQDIIAQVVIWNLQTGEENKIKYKANKRSIFQLVAFEQSQLVGIIVRQIDNQTLKIEYYKNEMGKLSHVCTFEQKNQLNLQKIFKMNKKSKIGLLYKSQQQLPFEIKLNSVTVNENYEIKLQKYNIDLKMPQITTNKYLELQIRDFYEVHQQIYYFQISTKEKNEEQFQRQNKKLNKIESKNKDTDKRIIKNFKSMFENKQKQLQKFYNFYYDSKTNSVSESKIKQRTAHCIQFIGMYRQLNYKQLIHNTQTQTESQIRFKSDNRINLPIYYIFVRSQEIKMIQKEQNISLISWPSFKTSKFVLLKTKFHQQIGQYFISIVDIPFKYRQQDTSVFFLEHIYDWDYDLLYEVAALF